MNNIYAFCLTAAAGTKFCQRYIPQYLTLFIVGQELYNITPSVHSKNINGSGFRLLSKIPHCWLPIEPTSFLSDGVAIQSPKMAKSRAWLAIT